MSHELAYYYYQTNDPAVLGVPDVMASIGNPLKGLMGGVRWAPPPLLDSIPSSLEWFNVGLDEIMIDNDTFDWSILEDLLQGSASRHMHSVFSVYIHWPGQEPLRLPPHLRDIELFDTTSNGKSPNYGDPRILTALEQYIRALGEKYDGDTRIAAIHVGLLGFWGEGHTYPDTFLVPNVASRLVAQWYTQAFAKTQIQARYPGPNAADKGLYDGSLFYNSLDGEANGGGDPVGWFMWPQIKAAGQEMAWKKNIMGGETRPELQDSIFTDQYPSGTELHQPFALTVETLHISYILHHHAFVDGGYQGTVLETARRAHASIGYAFSISNLAALRKSLSPDTVDIHVTVTQIGIAPFYYDLSLVLDCAEVSNFQEVPGVNELVEQGQSRVFQFDNVPATPECLSAISLRLESSYAYAERPILFAQGVNGRVSLSLPQQANRTADSVETS
jgi:hypothetical protein